MEEVLEVLDADQEDRTDSVLLPGAPGTAGWVEDRIRALGEAGVGAATLERLSFLYGTQLETLLGYGAEDPSWLEALHPDLPVLRGEIRNAVENEMALTLIDVMDRRTALLLFSPDSSLAGVEAAADIAAGILDWDADRRAREVEEYRAWAAYHRVPEA